MIIKSATLAATEVELKKFPQDNRFEIVFIGKSNVGKSSFINSMLGRTGLARTSSHPGKTRTANFYLINESFYFVDMPGYGYAETSKTQKLVFERIITEYLDKRATDFIVFFLIDHRHPPTNNDKEMFKKLISREILPVLILTKTDKVKKSQRAELVKTIRRELGLEEDDLVFEYSTENGSAYKETIWSFIEQMVE